MEKYEPIADVWTQQRFALHACVEKHAGIDWHTLDAQVLEMRARTRIFLSCEQNNVEDAA